MVFLEEEIKSGACSQGLWLSFTGVNERGKNRRNADSDRKYYIDGGVMNTPE